MSQICTGAIHFKQYSEAKCIDLDKLDLFPMSCVWVSTVHPLVISDGIQFLKFKLFQ